VQPSGDNAGTFVFFNDRLHDACIKLAERPDVLYLRAGACVTVLWCNDHDCA
jgi:hypothetical protein